MANEGHLAHAERLLTLTVRQSPGVPGIHRARLLLARLLAARGLGRAAAQQTAHAVRERPDQAACWVAAVQEHLAAGLALDALRLRDEGRRLFPHEAALKRWKDQDFRPGADPWGDRGSGPPTGTVIASGEAGNL